MSILVFDLGGTHLRCGVASASGIQQIERSRVRNFLDGLAPDAIAEDIVSRIADYIDRARNIDMRDPIVLAFPGPIEGRRFVVSAATLYGSSMSDMPDIAADLHARTGREVHILNDVSASAWGLSARTPARRFMVVTVSSGIGAKLFDRTSSMGVIDDPAFAGEIGHFVVDPSPGAPLCDCGGRGHLGAIASGRGVERHARRRCRDNSLTNEDDVVPSFLRGEAWAIQALRETAEPLARTLIAVTMAIGLDKVFIMGGFAQSVGSKYAVLLNELIACNSQCKFLGDRLCGLVELAGINEELCLSGAACYGRSLGLAL